MTLINFYNIEGITLEFSIKVDHAYWSISLFIVIILVKRKINQGIQVQLFYSNATNDDNNNDIFLLYSHSGRL